MPQHSVSLVRYETPFESVQQAVDLANGWRHLSAGAKVFIKPNIVFWTKAVPFPKWGVITTSRVVEDMVKLLKDHGVSDITIGEGMVSANPKDRETAQHAFTTLGYDALRQRYGVRVLDIMQRPFESVDLGDGMALNFNADILHCDMVVNLPVMKAHNQTMVSLGIKNLKGTIDIKSRKRCHSADPERDLHHWVARLADRMPPMLTVYDGIYTNERGPGFDGKMHRRNLLMAATDVLAGDMAAARVLGHEPQAVPHLAIAAERAGRPVDLSDVTVRGLHIDDVAAFHAYDFDYQCDDNVELPVPLARQGIQGIYYRKYDTSMCTYCSGINGLVLSAIRFAWQGTPFDEVEVLTGKMMRPSPGKKKTILLGKCMYQANREHPDINEMIAVKGCPPKLDDILEALQKAGIQADPGLFANYESLPGFFMGKYQGKPEFDEALFRVD